MENKNIEERVVDKIAERLSLDKSKISLESRFIEELGMDSLDQVEIITEFEEEFGIEIPNEDAEKIKSVGDATKYISRYQQKQQDYQI